MRCLIIVLGLGGLDGHYDQLMRRLAAIKAEPEGRSTWILRKTDRSVAQLRADLSRYMHSSDELIVAELASAA